MSNENERIKCALEGLQLSVFVESPQMVASIPERGRDSVFDLWMAEVRLVLGGVCTTYPGVLFLEHDNGGFNSDVKVVQICGIECESGRPAQLQDGHAAFQQTFIQQLREITTAGLEAVGSLAFLFEGRDYMAEGKVTAAFINARQERLLMAVGRADRATGEYELFLVDPVEDGWLLADYLDSSCSSHRGLH